ncbi:MAG TPA: TonB family protein [Pyrinomonadaceae bacterium]|nr:TonB family protein [Pyrinomonadaceae bacterium]
MQRLLKAAFLTCILLTCAAVAQEEKTNTKTVPVRWERYRAKERNVSALFPKLPVLLSDYSKTCFGEESVQYVAYAENSVFTLKVTFKVKPDRYCPQKKEFSGKNFEERLREIRDLEGEKKEIPLRAGDKATAKFAGKNWIRAFFNDSKNNRWFELYVAGRDLNKPAVDNFLESLKIGQQADGIEIGEGAPINYGDAAEPEQKEAAKTNSGGSVSVGSPSNGSGSGIWDETGVGDGSQTKSGQSVVTEPVFIVFKPRAKYTDAARTNNIQGTVRLRVTFLANGGIGSIAVVSALADGLTEQAVAAARKIFFLPSRRNNVNFSVIKIVEYRFALY